MGRLADPGQGDALQCAQHDAQGRAVGEHRHGAAVVGGAHTVQGGEIAVQHILRRLAALHVPQVHAAVEVVHLLGVCLVQLVPRVILPHTHVDLAEGGLQMQGQSLGQPDGTGCDLGAVEVAGIHGVNVHVLKALAQGIDLLVAAVVGDHAVVVAVSHAVEVALRLRVADEIDLRHTTVTHCFSSCAAAGTACAGSSAYCRSKSTSMAPWPYSSKAGTAFSPSHSGSSRTSRMSSR